MFDHPHPRAFPGSFLCRIVLACILWTGLAAILSPPAAGDLVKTRDGRTLEGTILEETEDHVLLEMERAIGKVKTKISRKDVISVERTLAPREEYANRRGQVPDADWPGHLALAQWCATKDLKLEAGRHLVHVLTRAGEAPEVPEAKKLAHRLGYRLFPEEGWLTEDEFWTPKGFQRWKGAWVTKEFARADHAYDAARSDLEKLRKRADYQQGVLGEHAADYNPLAAEYESLGARLVELEQDGEKTYAAATAALGRTGSTQLTQAEMHGLVQDAYGNWLTVDGRVVVRSTEVNTGAWQEFWVHQRRLRAIGQEYERVVRRRSSLADQMNAIAGKARKSGARADATARESDRVEEKVRETEQQRAAAKAAMESRLGEDGLPRRLPAAGPAGG